MSAKPKSQRLRTVPVARPRAPSPRRKRLLGIVGVVILATSLASVWLALRFDPFGRAHTEFVRRNYRDALKASEDYLKRWPGERRASLLAARSATRLGLTSRAESHFANTGTLAIDDLHDRAYGLVLMKQPRKAAEFYEQLLARKPDDALALKRLAAVLMDHKRYKELPPIAERLMAIPGEAVAGHTLSGIAHHVSQHYPEAAADFLKVLELDPGLKSMPLPAPLFWNHLAIDLLAQGKSAEARTYLTRGVDETRDAGLTELLGLSYHQEGRDDEAERYWRLAIERDPSQSHAWLDLGQLAISRRQPEEAVKLLSRAVELDPDAVEPYQNLSMAYKLLDKPEESVRFQKRAADLRAKDPRNAGSARNIDRDSAVAASAAGRQR